MVMSFGSGDISTQVASDQVQLGAVTCSAEVMASLFCSFRFLWCDTGLDCFFIYICCIYICLIFLLGTSLHGEWLAADGGSWYQPERPSDARAEGFRWSLFQLSAEC